MNRLSQAVLAESRTTVGWIDSLLERYGGAAQERAVWYHGTNPKHLHSILSQGLIPDPKKRAWSTDNDASYNSVSRVSYGGIYLTRNLMTATSSATNHHSGGAHRDGALVVIMSIQPRTLIADEDAVASRVRDIQMPGMVSNAPSIVLHLYMLSLAQPDAAALREAQDQFVTSGIRSMESQYPPLKERTVLRAQIEAVLRDGFSAVLLRQTSHLSKEMGSGFAGQWTDAWIQASVVWDSDHDVYAKRRAAAEASVPKPPSPGEGEAAFVAFVDRMTRSLKDMTRKVAPGSFTHARILQPIRYKGSNRITGVALVRNATAEELVEMLVIEPRASKYTPVVEMKWGSLPADFRRDYAGHSEHLFVKRGRKISLEK